MNLPGKLLESLKGTNGFDQQAFERVHESGEQVTSVRINPLKFSPAAIHFEHISPIPWSNYGYYLRDRPSFTFDPLFHAGCYYVQEASSMFLEQVFRQLVDCTQPLKILDLSAAPGGKSTHIQTIISKESLLVSNEVIRSRANILKDNIIKWGVENVVVTNNDPRDFGKLKTYFDVIVVDAPCSGSGLFRRDKSAIEEWSEQNVQLCSQRQQRILADILPSLKPGGLLVYSTCSYSQDEDERITSWLLKEFLMDHCALKLDPGWGIIETQPGYRFWPDKVKGEGFYISCMKKSGEVSNSVYRQKSKANLTGKNESEIIADWIGQNDCVYRFVGPDAFAVPKSLAGEFDFIIEKLSVIYFGVMIGEVIRDKIVPAHALAMSKLLPGHIERIELDYPQAINYLKKKEMVIDAGSRGWKLVTYHQFPLGWINVLPNRINNYYPKELRILKL